MISRAPSVALLRSLAAEQICLRCAHRLARAGQSKPPFLSTRRLQSAIARDDRVGRTFFWANAFKQDRRDGKAAMLGISQVSHNTILTSKSSADFTNSDAVPAEEHRHRRRKRLKAAAQTALDTSELPLPPDASSSLSQTAAAAPAKSLRRLFSTYLALAKPRLAFLIVLTTTASYSIYPVPALFSSVATDAPSLSALTLVYLTSGTFLTIASANTLNMLFEPRFDAQMSRTRNRPLVRGLLSKRSATIFAFLTGVFGVGLLWYGVNPTTALLGAGNLALYAFAYTPLKRIHPINTWVGALVGAVPPLMGWTAAASQYSVGVGAEEVAETSRWAAVVQEARTLLCTEQAAGGWLLAALLFAWQFPHFFALSHGVRAEYAGAGYKMLSSSNTPMATRVSLRYSVAMFPICAGLVVYEVTDPAFFFTSSVINAWMLREAVRFWRFQGAQGSARALFWASVWQLPIVLVLAMVQKKGLFDRIRRSVMGEEDHDAEDMWEDEEDSDIRV